MNARASGAILSSDGVYRYSLWRDDVTEGPVIMWLMCNPSTADHMVDDPTVRRVVAFSRRWDYRRIVIGNLWAYRSADMTDLTRTHSPVGWDNHRHLETMALSASRIVAAYGSLDRVPNEMATVRVADVVRQMRALGIDDPWVLALNTNGRPRHPLYVPANTAPHQVPWRRLT